MNLCSHLQGCCVLSQSSKTLSNSQLIYLLTHIQESRRCLLTSPKKSHFPAEGSRFFFNVSKNLHCACNRKFSKATQIIKKMRLVSFIRARGESRGGGGRVCRVKGMVGSLQDSFVAQWLGCFQAAQEGKSQRGLLEQGARGGEEAFIRREDFDYCSVVI